MHGIGPIFSNTVLEKTMSLSTAEAEYKGVYRGTKYAVSLIFRRTRIQSVRTYRDKVRQPSGDRNGEAKV